MRIRGSCRLHHQKDTGMEKRHLKGGWNRIGDSAHGDLKKDYYTVVCANKQESEEVQADQKRPSQRRKDTDNSQFLQAFR